jgi:hypothetical protein
MGISSMVLHVTTGDTYSAMMSLDTIYDMQSADGMLPYAGPPVNFLGDSDTYHLWALIGTLNTWDATANVTFARKHWDSFQKAVNCSVSKIRNSPAQGLMYVDKTADWQRCCQGKQNIAANSLLYGVLWRGSLLAAALNMTSQASEWASAAEALRASINEHLWDYKSGAFLDNTEAGNTLHPQDGNSLAAWFNVTGIVPGRASKVSDFLVSNWGQFGSSSPEWEGNIGTFAGSMEVMAHATTANRPDRALAMARLQWGYMLNNPNSTESTFWEGYNKDGTFNFGGAYMSNSHGWATGVAAALSLHVLGLRGVTPGASEYVLEPRPGDLKHCQGRLPVARREESVGGKQYVDAEWALLATAFTVTVDGTNHPLGHGSLVLSSDLLGASTSNMSVWLTIGNSTAEQVTPNRRVERQHEHCAFKTGAQSTVSLLSFAIPPHRHCIFVVKAAVRA